MDQCPEINASDDDLRFCQRSIQVSYREFKIYSVGASTKFTICCHIVLYFHPPSLFKIYNMTQVAN